MHQEKDDLNFFLSVLNMIKLTDLELVYGTLGGKQGQLRLNLLVLI